MSLTNDEIRELLTRAVGLHKEKFIIVDGTVKSVDWDKRNCVVTTKEYGDVENVGLRAAGDGSKAGYVSKPTINSVVVIGLVYNMPANSRVLAFTSIDMISLCDSNGNEDMSVDLTVNPAKFVFNGGNNGAMVMVQALYNAINRLETTMNAHQHIAPTGGGVTTANGSQTITPETTLSDLSDNNFKH